jgi:hypothetical protein
VRGVRGNSHPYRAERPPLHLLHLLTAANGTEETGLLHHGGSACWGAADLTQGRRAALNRSF